MKNVVFAGTAISLMFVLQCTQQADSPGLESLLLATSGLADRSLVNQGACNPAEAGVSNNSAWTAQWGSTQEDYGRQVATDRQGSIYVTGVANGSMDGNTIVGANDIFITKFDQAGNKLWTRFVGGTAQDLGFSAATDSRCNVIVSGYTRGSFDGHPSGGEGQNAIIAKYDTNGTKLWTAQATQISANWGSVAVDGQDNLYITGYSRPNTNVAQDLSVVKYDSSGNQVWLRQIARGEGQVVTVDDEENVYVAGTAFDGFNGLTTTGPADLFIAKYDSAGSQLWVELSNASSPEFAYAITTDVSGNVYFGGHMRLFKYSPTGTRLWAQSMQAPGGTPGATDDIRGVAIDSSGKLHVVGYTSGQFTGATSLGNRDIFAAEVNAATGAQIAIRQLGTNQDDEGWGVAFDSNDNMLISGTTLFGALSGHTNAGLYDPILYRNP